MIDQSKGACFRKLIIGLSCFLLVSSLPAFAQEERPTKDYRVWVKTIDQGLVKGLVHSLQDSSFVVRRYLYDSSELTSISFELIKKVRFRRKGIVTKGALLGVAVGAIASTISVSKPRYEGYHNARGLLVYPFAFTAVGGILSSFKIRRITKKELENTQELRRKLIQYLTPIPIEQ